MVFLFPGQASQQVGMGKDFYDNFSQAQDIFAQADEILGYEISRMCFEGSDEKLKMTQNTQPALLVVSTIAYTLFGQTPFMAAGHSLGEYSALVAAGALSFSDAVLLVHKRGKYMQQAVPVGIGSMAALIGVEYHEVEQAIKQIESGVVEIANWNSREQIVIAGHKEAVAEAVERIDAMKSVILPVSAPFHCELMKDAEEKLSYDLEHIEFKDLQFPVITNVDAEPIVSGEKAREALKRQVSRTVLWYRSMEVLQQEKTELIVELGSGKVLAGLLKRISRKWNPRPALLNIDGPDTLEKTVDHLKQM